MAVSIAPLGERDFFSWYSLLGEYAGSIGAPTTDENVMRVWTALQEPGCGGVIAKDDSGATVGFALFVGFERLLSGETGVVLEDVYVTPSARRQGVATALVEHVRTKAEQDRRGTLRWATRTDDVAAQALQQRFASSTSGWVLTEMPVA